MPLSVYIDPPERPDGEAIVEATADAPAFTWGDHRKMLDMLEQLDADDPVVASARMRLDANLINIGWMKDGAVIQICRWCHRKETEPHEIECRESNDPSLWVKREALSYQYITDKFVVAHTTSVPMTDEEAIEYFPIVQLMFPDDVSIRYITRKGLNESDWKMMPFQFVKEVWEVVEINVAG